MQSHRSGVNGGVYVCVHRYTYVYLCVCMYVCVYVCMCVCMYVCVCVCMYVCVYVCMYVCVYMRTCIHRGWHVRMCLMTSILMTCIRYLLLLNSHGRPQGP